MVEIIKKIVLIFIGTGIDNRYQADVKIFDSCNKLIYKGQTKKGKLVLYLKNNDVYKLIATSFGDYICTSFVVAKEKYIFAFNRSVFKNNTNLRTITFLLTDANYNNLPIEEGEIILWQR